MYRDYGDKILFIHLYLNAREMMDSRTGRHRHLTGSYGNYWGIQLLVMVVGGVFLIITKSAKNLGGVSNGHKPTYFHLNKVQITWF